MEDGRLISVPVSYTHLDVYKRQLEETAIAFRKKTEADQGIGLTHKVLGNSVGSMSGLLHMMGAYPGAWIEENGRLVPGEISDKTKRCV